MIGVAFVIIATNGESGFSRSAVESPPEPLLNEKLVDGDEEYGEHFLPLRSAVESVPTVIE